MSRAEITLARSICYFCPVAADCLRTALEAEEHWGIWGGLTPAERSRAMAAASLARSEDRIGWVLAHLAAGDLLKMVVRLRGTG